MTEIPGLWETASHEPIPVEDTWNEFVLSVDGCLTTTLLTEPPDFENADYLFRDSGVVAELKEIETEFGTSQSFRRGFDQLMTRLVAEDPDWRPALFGGNGRYPTWFHLPTADLARFEEGESANPRDRNVSITLRHLGWKV